MGTSLTGVNISASYLGLLKSTDSSAIGSSAKTITDGAGNDLPIKLSTAQFLVSDGSSSAPTIGFSSDTDTGLYRTGSGVLGITSNGTLSGEVTLTGYRVRKNSTASAPVYSFIGETTTGLHSLDTGRLDFILSGNRAFGMTYGSGVSTLQTLSTDKMAFSVGGSERLRIINDGKIGIGTSTVSASAFMEIKGVGSLSTAIVKLMPSDATSSTALYNTSDGGDNAMSQYGTASGDTILQHIATSGELKLRVNGTTGLTMNQSQNIKLDAYGSGSITGTATQRLGVDSSGNVIEIPIGSGAVDGSGTANTVTMWTDSDTIGNAPITISGNDSTFAGNIKLTGSIMDIRFIESDTTDVNSLIRQQTGLLRFDTISDDEATITTRVALDHSTGNLGLNTTSPLNGKLQIDSSTNQISIETGTAGDGRLHIGHFSNGTFIGTYGDDGGAADLIRFGTHSGDERMRLDSSGKLLINNTSSRIGEQVNVTGNGILIEQTDGGIATLLGAFGSSNVVMGAFSNNDLELRTNNTARITIDTSGNSTFEGDIYLSTDSDILKAGTNPFRLFTNGTLALSISSSQNATFAGTVTISGSSSTPLSTQRNINSGAFGLIVGKMGNSSSTTAGHTYTSLVSGIETNTDGAEDGFFAIEVSDAGSLSEKMRLDSSGNLGLGTTSPLNSLDIFRATGDASIRIQAETVSDSTILKFRNGNSDAHITVDQTTSNKSRMFFDTDNADGFTTVLSLEDNRDTLMYGNVGINDTSPSKGKLQIDQESNTLSSIQLVNTAQSSSNFGSYPISIFFGDEQKGSSARHQASINAVREAWSDSPASLTFKTSATVNGATEKMRITSGGAVGINTSSPIGNLHVVGDTGSAGRFYISDVDNGTATGDSVLAMKSGTHAYYYNRDDGNLYLGTNDDSEKLVILSNGNVGIGTASPSQKLHVDGIIYSISSGTDGGQIRLANSGGGSNWYWAARTTGLNLGELGAADGRIFIANGGNVGIGTTSPVTSLTLGTGTTGMSFISSDTSFNSGKIAVIKQSEVGSGNGHLLFETYEGGSGGGERMRITSGGDVGIGLTNPDEKLHVDGTSRFNGDMHFGTSTGGLIYKPLESSTHAERYFVMFDYTNDASYPFLTNRTPNGAVVIKTGTAAGGGENEHFRIKGGDGTVDAYFTNTNLGIGTTSPAQKLHIHNTATLTATYQKFSNGTATSGTTLGIDADGDFLINNVENKVLKFYTNDTERMRITSDGTLLIGCTSEGNTNAYFSLESNDRSVLALGTSTTSTSTVAVFRNPNGGVGSVSVSGSATAFNTSSDYRLKEDLQDFNALEIASKIKMYNFKWKADDSRSYGVMAHELEEVLPQAVTGEKDAEEMQSVDYSKLVPILLKSIQELKAEIDELKKNK